MKRFMTVLLLIFAITAIADAEVSTRKERKAIIEGNAAYRAKDFSAALTHYKIALRDNPTSLVARFNQALAMVQVANAMDPKKEKEKAQMLEQATTLFTEVAAHHADNPSLASRASYNLGNISYLAKDYPAAVEHYKQALRLNPNDDKARKNLRLAQMKIPKDNKKDQDKKDQDKKDQDKKDNKKDQDKKDQDKKDQDKKDQQNQPQNRPQSSQPRQGGMSPQAADRILKRSEDKEKETMKRANFGTSRPKGKRW